MPYSEFIPGAPASSIADSMSSGLNLGMSLVERKQAMQDEQSRLLIAQQDAAQRQKMLELLMPVHQAKAAADLQEANAELSGSKQAEDARAAAYQTLPTARAEFDNLMALQDPDKRAEAGLQWIGKFGHLDNIKGLGNEFTAKKDIIAKMHAESAALRHLQAQTAAQKELITARGDVSKDVASIRTNRPDKLSKYIARRDEAEASGDYDTAQLYDDAIAKENAAPTNTAEGSAQVFAKLQAAIASGDSAAIEFYTRRAKALTDRGVNQKGGSVARLVEALSGDSKPTGNAPIQQQPIPTPVPQAPADDPLQNIKF